MADIPPWLRDLVSATPGVRADQLSRYLPPADGGRDSAILVLFGEGVGGPDVLLIERAGRLADHAGEPAFPGGGSEPTDDGPVGTALREATEEVGLDPAGVDVLGILPALHIPVSNFVVTPVLGWWRAPSPVRVVDPREVARVVRVPIGELVDPATRSMVRHPSGHVGPAFTARGMLVWGFTAGLLDRLFDLAGWSRPWDRSAVVDLPVGGWRPLSRPDPPADTVN